MKNNELLKTPFNYIGGKYKLLNQILPLFPNNIDTFVDLFGGGFNVGINVEANKIIYNDICKQMTDLILYIKNNDTKILLNEIDFLINKFNLSKENSDNYYNFRKKYNEINNTPIAFYVLLCFSFNNQIRFNKKNEFNVPFGKRDFNDNLKNNFIKFCDKLHNKKVIIYNKDFRVISDNIYKKDNPNLFIYVDPPYYKSIVSYNKNECWNKNDEIDLLHELDKINEKNIKFALSNNLKYGNEILNKWKNKYNIHYLNYSYSNCNYHKKDKSNNDTEILITNY